MEQLVHLRKKTFNKKIVRICFNIVSKIKLKTHYFLLILTRKVKFTEKIYSTYF